jgi:hypothetical protein
MKYKRKCLICDKDIYHTSKYNRNAADKKKTPCGSCSSVEKNKKYGNNKKFIERYATFGNNTGELNSFYGKKHSQLTINKLQQVDKSYTKTKEFRQKISKATKGKKNPMYGKSYYNIWVEKYGKEEADRRQKIKKEKNSIASRGKRNPMYGKRSPNGSGNGWSGWYKGWFFRSLKELSYMIKEIEKKNKKWRTAETKDLRIKYIDYKGDERTYVADFLINEEVLVEVKPTKLKSSLSVRLKAEAAKKFCKNKGLIYKIKDVDRITDKEIRNLHDSKLLKFTSRYEALYNERIKNIKI